MRLRASIAVLAAALLLEVISITGARAGSNPPPPPPTPRCGFCSGPPPPPTPIPTLASQALPTAIIISAQLSPVRVSRGHQTKLTVTAPAGGQVVVSVQYRKRKPVVSTGKVGGEGTYIKSIRVPKNAMTGKALVVINVRGGSTPYSTTLPMTVTK